MSMSKINTVTIKITSKLTLSALVSNYEIPTKAVVNKNKLIMRDQRKVYLFSFLSLLSFLLLFIYLLDKVKAA